MATSGTYSWAPSAGDLALQAFRRCGVKRVEITAEHLMDAANEANLIQVEWASKQPNLWLMETYSVTLTPSQGIETLPERIIAPVAAYISTTQSGVTTDRIITPLSTEDYHALPNKAQAGIPTSDWFDRRMTPELRHVPDQGASMIDTLALRALTRPVGVVLGYWTNVRMPYRWLDAFVSCLAYRLAIFFALERAPARETVA